MLLLRMLLLRMLLLRMLLLRMFLLRSSAGRGLAGREARTQAFRPTEQPGSGDGPGGGAVDRVEGGHQAELIERERHACRDRAAHPAALDGQRDPEPVIAPSGLAPRLRAGGQYPENLVHQWARRCSEAGSSPS